MNIYCEGDYSSGFTIDHISHVDGSFITDKHKKEANEHKEYRLKTHSEEETEPQKKTEAEAPAAEAEAPAAEAEAPTAE